ncbi:hypothetical protein [Klebsiella pneumoniae IS53]|nr:hypothetical protein [Klebsiella pneumoniae IS53]
MLHWLEDTSHFSINTTLNALITAILQNITDSHFFAFSDVARI